MSDQSRIVRLTSQMYPRWQALGRMSLEEQGVTRLDYWEKPWDPERLIWVVEEAGEPFGHIYIQATDEILNHPSFEHHHDYDGLRFMLSDLYVLPNFRGRGWSTKLIHEALRDLQVDKDEPIALLLPISETGHIPLSRVVGARRLVGYKGWGPPVYGSMDELMEASRRMRSHLSATD